MRLRSITPAPPWTTSFHSFASAALAIVFAVGAVLFGLAYGGRLRNAHQVEALTANLISINRRHKAHAGVRITDV